ncbi:MAG: Fe-S-containing protein [Schaalia turicensis]
MIEQMSQATLALLLTALATGAAIGVLPARERGRSGRAARRWAIGIGVVAGFVSAFVLTLVNTLAPRAVNRQTVALWTLPLAVLLAIVFVSLLALRARRAPSTSLDSALLLVMSAYLALIVFRAAPTAMAQAVMMFPRGIEVFATTTMLALVGYGLGWLIPLALGALSWRIVSLGRRRTWPAALVVAVLALTHVMLVVRILQAQRVVSMSNEAFTVLSWLINHEAVFPIAAMFVLLLVAALVVREGRSLPRVGSNPAEGRLYRARVRVWKTMAGVAAGGYLCGALLITLGVVVGSAEVELSEPESYSVVEERAVIDIADISDGHLHRYAYTTSSGVEVRFIVIQKAGASFGVGLDACEICGPTGYYEKDGKIICKLCEVAMNIATIGFKGGCNPIPIEYEVSNGTLTVPLSVLEANASVFA